MRSAQLPWILGAAAILVYSLIRKGSGLQSLNFYPAGVKKIGWEGMTPILTIDLGAQNTSNQDFTINSIAGNVYSQGILIGNVGSFVPQTIARNSEKILSIKFRLQITGVVNNIVDAINSGSFSQNLEVDLMANVDNLQIPINFNLKVG